MNLNHKEILLFLKYKYTFNLIAYILCIPFLFSSESPEYNGFANLFSPVLKFPNKSFHLQE